MADLIDNHDTKILAELQALHELRDPVPDDLAERVKFTLTVEALHAEVAQLTTTPLVPSRADSTKTSDTITFSTDDVSLMVAVSNATDHDMTLDGWLSKGPRTVEVRTTGAAITVSADPDGRFAVHEVPRGRTWFVIHPPEGSDDTPVVTQTVDL